MKYRPETVWCKIKSRTYKQGEGRWELFDFGLGGKLIKASIPARKSEAYWLATAVPNRLLRRTFAGSGPTRLHYRRLEPNFEEYWQPDSDAVNDLDEAEVAMWFESRGDICLNCLEGWWLMLRRDGPLVIQVRKGGAGEN